MLVQIRRTAPPSVNATTTETGSVCPRNSLVVLTAISRGAEIQLSRFSTCRLKQAVRPLRRRTPSC